MTQVQNIGFRASSVYNAVKIRINNPQASVPAELEGKSEGEFNAVDIEVNNPKLNAGKNSIYSYPQAQERVTYDKSGIVPLDIPDLPVIPVAYKTSFINNRTFINAEFADEKKNIDKADNFSETDAAAKISDSKPVAELASSNQEPVFIELTEITPVPVPNVTTLEDEKFANSAALNFHGLNFKAAKPEIVPDGNLKPSVDADKIAETLNGDDYKAQQKTLRNLMAVALNQPENITPYLTTPVFSAIIDVINKDISNLEKPSEKQLEIREKIVLNEFAKTQQIRSGKKPEEVELPYTITDEEKALAAKISPSEWAEYNKSIGIYTLASLDKAYINEYEKQTGSLIPLTDLPGINDIVEVLSAPSSNYDLKISAMDALMHISRQEYKNELLAVFKVLTDDKDTAISYYAETAIKELNRME